MGFSLLMAAGRDAPQRESVTLAQLLIEAEADEHGSVPVDL
jgi:hypothetical protein